MITEKTEDGGGRLNVVNFDEKERVLWVWAISQDGSTPERATLAANGSRSDPIDLPYGK